VRTVPGRFDVVVSTNGGHPLDRNLYQAVKGMAAAERVVRPGGTIIMAASCTDGLPAGSAFARLLEGAKTPDDLLRPGGPATPDGWQTQVLGRVLAHARVELYCEGLTSKEVALAQLAPVGDISEAVARATRPGDRVCVLPLGPLTVATAAG
jgi:lactate racemase